MISCWRWPSAALTWRRMISRPRSDHVGAAWPKGGRRRTACSLSCYRRGADGPLGRRSGFWYRRCLSSCQRLTAVCAACRSSALTLSDESVERAISRSSRCFQTAGSVSSWPPPAGRGSWGLMPLAARHTASSPMMASFGRPPGGAHTGCVLSWLAWPRIRLARSVTSWDRFAR